MFLVLQVLLTDNSDVEDMSGGASSSSKPSLFFCYESICMWFQSVCDFAWMTGAAHCAVFLAQFKLPFGNHNDSTPVDNKQWLNSPP